MEELSRQPCRFTPKLAALFKHAFCGECRPVLLLGQIKTGEVKTMDGRVLAFKGLQKLLHFFINQALGECARALVQKMTLASM